MSAAIGVPVSSRLVGLRMHFVNGPEGQPKAPRTQALLDLKQRNRQREADDKALRELVTTARQQVESLPQTVQQRLDEVAGIAVELGLSIARELVGAALDRGDVDPTPTVIRCLQDCVHGSRSDDLVLKLHPADLDSVASRLSQLPDVQDDLGSGEAGRRFVCRARRRAS